MAFALFLILVDFETFKGDVLSKHEVWPAGYLAVDNGELYVNEHRKRIVVFTIADGQKSRVITPPENFEIMYFGVTENEIHLALSGKGTQSFARLDRATGKVLGKSANGYRYFVGKAMFRVPITDFEQEGYPKILTASKDGRPFFKKPKEYLDFPDVNPIWLVPSKDQYNILTPMTNNLYIYNDTVRSVEDGISRTSLGPAPIKRLSLKKYKQPVQNYSLYTTGPATGRRLRTITRLGQQFIVFLGRVGNGYVVCYEVPDEVNGIVIGNHLGIQFLDEGFEPTRFTERYGQVAGIDRDSLLILYPDGKQTNSQKEHYGLTGRESDQELRKIQARYNRWQERELSISLEWVER